MLTQISLAVLLALPVLGGEPRPVLEIVEGGTIGFDAPGRPVGLRITDPTVASLKPLYMGGPVHIDGHEVGTTDMLIVDSDGSYLLVDISVQRDVSQLQRVVDDVAHGQQDALPELEETIVGTEGLSMPVGSAIALKHRNERIISARPTDRRVASVERIGGRSVLTGRAVGHTSMMVQLETWTFLVPVQVVESAD